MPVHVPPGYTLPVGDLPLTHARIVHAGNWIEGAVTASSTDAAAIYAAEAPANSLLVERWKPAAAPAAWTLVPDAAVEVDCCVVAAHTFGTAGATISVLAEVGGAWSTVASVSPSDDALLFFIFEPVLATGLRLQITGFSEAPTVGFIRFAKALQMEERTRYAGRTPFELARDVVVTGDRSVTGEPLTRSIVRAGQPLTFQWPHLSETFTKLEVKALLEAIDLDLFAIAERPETHPDDVALCWTSGSRARPSAIGAMDLHDLQISAEGYVGNG